MSETTKIIINTDGISDEQKATEKFQSAYREMLAELTSPGFIPVLCAHEAAHAVYFTVAGATGYKPVPATIKYDPEIDDYVGHLAAIEVVGLPTFVPGQPSDLLDKVACALAAGGVVARRLMPSSVGGDDDDRDRFEKLCDGLNREYPRLNIDFARWWKEAQEHVAKDLEKQEVMASIEQEALRLRPLLGL